MGAVGSLYINISAKNENLTKGLKKAQGDLLSFKNVVKTLTIAEGFNLAKNAVMSFGRAIEQNVSDSFKTIADFTRMSDRLGISTEALVGYADKAEDAGMEA